jgi:hypothetical protein
VDASGHPRTVCLRPGVLRRWQSAPVLGFGTKRPIANAVLTTSVDASGRSWTPRFPDTSCGLLGRSAVDSCRPGNPPENGRWGSGSCSGPGHRAIIDLIPPWRHTERTMTPAKLRSRGTGGLRRQRRGRLSRGRCHWRGGGEGRRAWVARRARGDRYRRDDRQPGPAMMLAPQLWASPSTSSCSCSW